MPQTKRMPHRQRQMHNHAGRVATEWMTCDQIPGNLIQERGILDPLQLTSKHGMRRVLGRTVGDGGPLHGGGRGGCGDGGRRRGEAQQGAAGGGASRCDATKQSALLTAPFIALTGVLGRVQQGSAGRSCSGRICP